MTVGEYIKGLRIENKLSQRELAELSGISNAEISRLETGDRKKPSPLTLRAIAPYLGVSSGVLFERAGFIKEAKEEEVYLKKIYRDERGKLFDLEKSAIEMYEKDSGWANLAFKVSKNDLSEWEMGVLMTTVEALLDNFHKAKNKQREHI